MKTHVFGGIWCPSAATFSLRVCEHLFGNKYEAAAYLLLKRQFYVNGLLASWLDAVTAIKVLQELIRLMKEAGFRLTKIMSNNRQLLDAFPPSELAKGHLKISKVK